MSGGVDEDTQDMACMRKVQPCSCARGERAAGRWFGDYQVAVRCQLDCGEALSLKPHEGVQLLRLQEAAHLAWQIK